MARYVPSSVHFVGSVALSGPRELFRVAGKILGPRLKRIPDGEPGARIGWVQFQWPLLRNNGAFVVDRTVDLNQSPVGLGSLCFAPGITPADIQFGELGYSREARSSYTDFIAARNAGELPRTTRFQVSLPTPRAVIHAAFSQKDRDSVLPVYEQAMFKEVGDLCSSIAHEDLCIQWDVCNEMVAWDRGPNWRTGGPLAPFDIARAKQDILDSLSRACRAIPPDVELGIHLCYGDLDAKHFFDPVDAGAMVTLANALLESAGRSVQYIHMPVPISATRDAFFQPFSQLRLSKDSELFLGLVQAVDGPVGAQQRIDMASQFVSEFGIATECGIARVRNRDAVVALLNTHAAVSRAP